MIQRGQVLLCHFLHDLTAPWPLMPYRELRDEASFIHEVYVDSRAQRLFEGLRFRHTMREMTK